MKLEIHLDPVIHRDLITELEKSEGKLTVGFGAYCPEHHHGTFFFYNPTEEAPQDPHTLPLICAIETLMEIGRNLQASITRVRQDLANQTSDAQKAEQKP